MKTFKSFESGFTFFEVMVAVVIGTVIASIAVYSVGGAKSDTQRAKLEAVLASVEQAKSRYLLDSSQNVQFQETEFEQIAPYLNSQGEPIGSLFDLLAGTGRDPSSFDLGQYGGQPASFDGGEIETGGSYPFDPSDPDQVYQALQNLLAMDPSDPNYLPTSDGILEALNRGTILEHELGDDGLGLYGGVVFPIADVLNYNYQDFADYPAKINYFSGLDSWQKTQLWGNLTSTDRSIMVENIDFAQVRSMMAIESSGYGDVLNYFSDSDAFEYVVLSGLNLTGWDPINKTLEGVDFTNTNVSVSQLNSPSNFTGVDFPYVNIVNANLSYLNLAGLITSNRYLDGVNFTGATISVTQLNQSRGYAGAKLTGRNLSGLSLSNKSLAGTDFSGSTNLSASVIAQTVNLRGLKLTGTGVTRTALQNALNAQVPPKTGFLFDLDSVTF